MSTTAVPSAAVQKQLKQGKVKKGIFSVIRHLVLALLAFIWLVPIAWLLLTSFSTDKGINFTRFVPESFTMWNYVSIMTQPDSVAQFPRWFMNTLVVACFNCVISTCFVLMVAYAISCCRFKGRKLLQNLSVTVNLFPRRSGHDRCVLCFEVHEPDQLLRRSDHGICGLFRPGLPDL